MDTRACLYCKGRIGLLRVMKSRFCSDEHEIADAREMGEASLKRLRGSAARFRAALENAEETARLRAKEAEWRAHHERALMCIAANEKPARLRIPA